MRATTGSRHAVGDGHRSNAKPGHACKTRQSRSLPSHERRTMHRVPAVEGDEGRCDRGRDQGVRAMLERARISAMRLTASTARVATPRPGHRRHRLCRRDDEDEDEDMPEVHRLWLRRAFKYAAPAVVSAMSLLLLLVGMSAPLGETTAENCADTHAPGSPYCTYGLRAGLLRSVRT